MYQNIFVKTNTNEAWVWDDKKGLMHFNFQPYAYKKDPNGKFQSIHGDKLTRVTSFVKNDPNLFESDIPETTRVLVDMYGDSDMPSEGIVTMGLDIEVEMITGLPDPQLGNNEITSIAYHDSATNEYTMLVLDKRKRIESRTIGNRHIVSCGNEKDLLLKFLDGMEAVGPHILTGWNCVDAREWVSTKNGLIRLSDISTDEITSQHGRVLNKWNSEKKANKLTLSNGKSILISDEHRIPVMSKSKNDYTHMNPLIRSCKDETVGDIKDKMKTDDVYCKIPLVRNNNHTKTIHNVDILQLLGFIYTDGTYAKSKNDGRITITGVDNCSISFYANLINQNGLSVNEIQPRALKKRKDHHSQEWQIRFTPSTKLKEYLPMIYSDVRNKKLSIDILSKLSEDEIAHFISGLIDGDGSVSTNLTGITISQKPQESRTLLYDLFAYFGICLNLTSSGIFIPSKEINRWIFDKMRITHVKRNERISRMKFRVDKNTPKKILREFCTDEFRIVKIKAIEETDEVIPMVDIQTENHYFTVGGINVHNCDKFDIPYLYNRIKRVLGKKTAQRLSPIGEMFYSPYRERWTIGGISTLDYMVVYKKFSYKELPSYALNAVSTLELGRGKIEYEGNLDDLMENDIETFIEYNITDVELILELDKKLQYIDLVRGICHVGHVPYEDFVYSSKYLEGALLTYLKRAGNIVAPNKPADRREKMDALKESGEQGFIGAFVKDPVPGRYEWMYDLDLTSLYPSIIMTLNISPETKVAKILNWDADEFIKGERDEYLINGEVVSKEKLKAFLDKYKYTVASNGVMYNTNITGLIPAILNEWFDKRVEYKDEMKKWGKAGDNVKYEFYKKRQLVQKILLNSLYGVLGLPAFRFYDLDNAEAVTLSGQTVIKKTEYAINHKYNKELGTDNVDYVQYVDTDSVFVSCLPLVKNRFPDIDPDDMELMTGKIYEIATEVQNYVNGFYNVFSKKFFNTEKHRLEIKQEMIARTGFWVKKKRYALWVISDNGVPMDELKVTGLDVVRSSFPKSFQKFMKEALVDILKSKDKDEIDENVLKFKRQLNDVLFAEVAKNSSIKDIKKYEEPIKDAVLGTFAKGTPSHVKAAINYNKLLKMFKCPPKYPPIKNGDKVKVAYLKNNRYGLEELAFRGDSDPQEIIQFVKDHFDAHELFNSELDGKLRAFYDALKWEFPSEHKKNAQKFFSF